MWGRFVGCVVSLCACVAIAAGVGCDPTPTPQDGGEQTAPDRQDALKPTLSSIEKNIFARSCALSSCHGGGAGGMKLGEGKSHGNLVGVDSVQVPGEKRVVAGDPESSLLYKVLIGKVGELEQMPPGVAISQEKIDTIKEWIKQGAKDD